MRRSPKPWPSRTFDNRRRRREPDLTPQRGGSIVLPTIDQFRAMALYLAEHRVDPCYRMEVCSFIAHLDELREDGWLSSSQYDELSRIIRPENDGTNVSPTTRAAIRLAASGLGSTRLQ